MLRPVASSSPETKSFTAKTGSLTVVGTGLYAVGQVTPESLAAIAGAQKLFHLVVDPVSRAWLEEVNPSAESLFDSYADGRSRPESYEEMVERILEPVRRGVDVCAAFYGHPGVLVQPSHEAIRRARALGLAAQMLPGISSEDCLFADLGVDPAARGCQSFEATDFLTRRRSFDVSSPLILWQIGAIGVSTYRNVTLWSREGLRVLGQVLSRSYPDDQEVVVYEAPRFAISEPILARLPLADLAEAPVSTGSTLYVPPRGLGGPQGPPLSPWMDHADDESAAACGPGALTLVGAGYRVAGHLTLQAQSALEQADSVFYLVTDPGTSAYMRSLHPRARSLHACYREGENGRLSSQRMVDEVSSELDRGLRVGVAFSGHPAIGLPAAHEMMRRARRDRRPARMLPAVSFEDCLFTDLGVDPGLEGRRMLDAGFFLERRPRLDPHCGLVLLQAGVVGWDGFREGDAGNREGFVRLAGALAETYPPDHEAVLYEIADFPFQDPRVDRVPIRDLAAAPVTVRTTLYIPPVSRPAKDPALSARLEASH